MLKQEKCAELSEKIRAAEDEACFATYATRLISDWRENGRDVAHVLKTIEKLKPLHPTERQNGRLLNTFSRLGFSNALSEPLSTKLKPAPIHHI
jgi:hypothetical protein